jgi:hypothetical protein
MTETKWRLEVRVLRGGNDTDTLIPKLATELKRVVPWKDDEIRVVEGAYYVAVVTGWMDKPFYFDDTDAVEDFIFISQVLWDDHTLYVPFELVMIPTQHREVEDPEAEGIQDLHMHTCWQEWMDHKQLWAPINNPEQLPEIERIYRAAREAGIALEGLEDMEKEDV